MLAPKESLIAEVFLRGLLIQADVQKKCSSKIQKKCKTSKLKVTNSFKYEETSQTYHSEHSETLICDSTNKF